METIPDEDELDTAHALARVRQSMFGRGPGGLTVSRYSLQERLGSGGEGAVYAAFDPELGRRVAIKLLSGGVSDYEEHGRLVREARLLASISHPNVVTIYDAGEYDLDDQGLGWGVFIVLELLEGTTLDHWLAAKSRSARAIVELFAEVGRGLQAVHDTGLVHRDIKPRNILVGDDGRVQLADFGIAYRTADTAAQTGHDSGTPRFMAPEQKDGAAPDPLADQWSFCAALWAALDGGPPAEEGQPVPRAPGVPRSVRRALERGLSLDPADRFPSVAALVDHLDGSRFRRNVIALAGVGGIAALAFAWTWDRPPSCNGFERAAAETYDEAKGAQIQAALAAFDSIDQPRAAGVRARLDTYIQDWTDARTHACEQTQAAQADARDLGVRQAACLDRALQSFHTITELLAHPDSAVAAALDAVLHRYRPVKTCVEDPPRVPPPADPPRPRIGAELVRVSVLTMADRFDEASAVLDDIDPEALSPGLSARWYGARATLLSRQSKHQDAEADYSEAIARGQRAGDEDYVVRVQIDLMHLVGLESSRHAEALRMAQAAVARAEVARTGRNTQAHLALAVGNLESAHGDVEQAAAQFRRVVSLCSDNGCGGGSDRLIAAARLGLGNVHLKSAQYAEAYAAFTAHHEITRGGSGFLGKQAWMSAYNLALVELDLGHFESAMRWVDVAEPLCDPSEWRLDYARAQIAFQRDDPDDMARAIDRAIEALRKTAPRSMWLVTLEGTRAGVHTLRGDHEQAQRGRLSTYEQTKREFGPDHVRTTETLALLAEAEHSLGAFAACLEHYGRVVEQRRASLRHDHPQVLLAEHGVGRCQLGLGQADLALPHLQRAYQAWSEEIGSHAPTLTAMSLDLSAALLATGDAEGARAPLLEALAQVPDLETPPRDEARLLFALARLEVTEDEAEAVALAHRARELFVRLGDRYLGDVAEVDRFVADHGFS